MQSSQLTGKSGSNTKHQLLQASDSASNRRMGDFGLVHGHDHDEDTDTESSHSSTGVKERQVLACCLQGTAEAENNSANHDGKSSTQYVTEGTSCRSSEESTSSEEGHDSTATSMLAGK